MIWHYSVSSHWGMWESWYIILFNILILWKSVFIWHKGYFMRTLRIFFLRYWWLFWLFLVWACWTEWLIFFFAQMTRRHGKCTWLLLEQLITEAYNYGTDNVSSFILSSLLLFPCAFNSINYFSLIIDNLFQFFLYDEYPYINLHEGADTHRGIGISILYYFKIQIIFI